jgi:hypothetical protein
MKYGVCNWSFADADLETTAAFLTGAGFENCMNIAEARPASVVLEVGERLFLLHAADSNRQAVDPHSMLRADS